MAKAIGHENAQGQINVTVTCECGSPITHTTSSGMHCSNPKCDEEAISDRLDPQMRSLFSNFDHNDPMGSFGSFITDLETIYNKEIKK